jgi:hypothetical protein
MAYETVKVHLIKLLDECDEEEYGFEDSEYDTIATVTLLMPVRAKQPREATRIQLLNLRCG